MSGENLCFYRKNCFCRRCENRRRINHDSEVAWSKEKEIKKETAAGSNRRHFPAPGTMNYFVAVAKHLA